MMCGGGQVHAGTRGCSAGSGAFWLPRAFVFLLGDDVKMEKVECKFAEVAHTQGLPFGRACVAFRERSFEGFPTFPMLHTSHRRLFLGRCCPRTSSIRMATHTSLCCTSGGSCSLL